MAIKVLEAVHTIRTHPRLMKNNKGDIVMTLHTSEKGIYIFLNGENEGRIVHTTDADFDGLHDLRGSITLYNCD